MLANLTTVFSLPMLASYKDIVGRPIEELLAILLVIQIAHHLRLQHSTSNVKVRATYWVKKYWLSFHHQELLEIPKFSITMYLYKTNIET